MNKLNALMKKDNLFENEEIELKRLKEALGYILTQLKEPSHGQEQSGWNLSDSITTNHFNISNYIGSVVQVKFLYQ